MRLLAFILIISFQAGYIKADNPGVLQDFTHVDRHVKAVSSRMIFNAEALVEALIGPFDSDQEKVRAIFAWIATNIEYNYTAFKNNVVLEQNVNEVLKAEKALCYGFSLVFQDFCLKAGIECEIIEGYAKGLGYEEGRKFVKPNHAWNALKIGDEWFLMDVTWASGAPKELMKNKRVIDLDSYFMADPQLFINTHLPADPTWQLLDIKQELSEFNTEKTREKKNLKIDSYDPKDYEGFDNYDKDILRFKRSLEFNHELLEFTEQLAFAYIYKGISLTDNIWQLSYNELVLDNDQLERSFHAYMDSSWMLIEPLSVIKIQKNRRIFKDEINYQTAVYHYEYAAELFNKGFNSKKSLIDINTLSAPHFNTSRHHFESVDHKSIYFRDAGDYLKIIDKYESRMKNR